MSISMGLLLALITYIGWGTGDIFGAHASRKVGAYKATALVYLFGFLLTSLYIPFALEELPNITPLFLFINLLMGAAYMMGNFFLNEGFKTSNASLVGIIVQSFPAVVLLLSALIFKDVVTLTQSVWILIIFIGVFLCIVDLNDLKRGTLSFDRGIKLALIAALIFSIYFTFLRVFIDQYGWFWPNYISFATFPLVLLIVKSLFKIKEKLTIPKEKGIVVATFLSAFLLRSGDIALNYGIGSGYAAIVTPIAGASPTLFIILSRLVFKDKLTIQQKMGLFIALCGIVLLSFFS